MDQPNSLKVLQAQINVLAKKVDKIYVLQQIDSETIRKSANSINVIVRLLSGAVGMNSQELWNTLLASDALVDTVKPTVDINIKDTPLKDYPVSKLKFMLMDMIRVIERSDDNFNMVDNSSSIHSTVTENILPIVTNTTINQTEVLSDLCTSQNQNSSTKNTRTTDSNDNLISINIPSGYVEKKNKEEEEARILRRKYHNKYKYLTKDITKQQCSFKHDLKSTTQVIPNNNEKILSTSNTETVNNVPCLPHLILSKFDKNCNVQHIKKKGSIQNTKSKISNTRKLSGRISGLKRVHCDKGKRRGKSSVQSTKSKVSNKSEVPGILNERNDKNTFIVLNKSVKDDEKKSDTNVKRKIKNSKYDEQPKKKGCLRYNIE